MTEPAANSEAALQVAALTTVGEHVDDPADSRGAAEDLLKLLGLTEAEIAAAQAKLKANAQTDPLAAAITDATSPQAVADASRKIAHLLMTGEIRPDQGRTTLYALQVCMTALRFSAQAQKPRETHPRLPKGPRSDSRPRPSTQPKRGRPRKGAPTE